MRKYVVVVIALLVAAAVLTYLSLRTEVKVETTGVFKVDKVEEVRVNTLYYQGLAEGGGYWYFSDRMALFKVEGFDKPIATLYPAVPDELRSEGYDHIGDVDYFNGYIYAPVEDVNYEKPIVIVYSAADFSVVKVIGPLPQSHMPWIALDSEGRMYSSEFSDVNEIKVYDPEGNLVETIKLNVSLQRVQGGCIYGDKYLILTTDDGGDWIYAVNLETGVVTKICAVKTPYEGEGVECGEGVIYFLVGTPEDMMNKLFIIHVRVTGR